MFICAVSGSVILPMPQKINLRNSPALFKGLKAYHIVAMFMYGAVLARLFILLPLVGRKFLAGGISDFFNLVTTIICSIEIILSLVKLIPIQLPLIVLQNWVKFFIIWAILDRDDKILNHSCYSLLIFSWCSYGFVGYIYWFYKLKGLGRVPKGLNNFYQNLKLIVFPIEASVEFITIFLSLKFINQDSQQYLKIFTQLVLLFYIPTKFYLYKNLIFKVFQINPSKED